MAAFNHSMKLAAQDEESPGGKTEWEDALIRHGIKAPPPKAGPTDDELQLAVQDSAAGVKQAKLENSTLKQLAAMEDNKDVEEDTIAKIRAKRLAEMKIAAAANKYGTVLHLQEKEFVPEVSKAPEDTYVVVHLYVHSRPECQVLAAHLSTVAAKFKAVKFVKMIASQCIHNYPDSKTPTLIVYKKGELLHNEVGLTAYGGLKMTADSLEWALAVWGVLKTELPENPLLAKPVNAVNITRFVGGKAKTGKGESDDDDDSDS